MNKEETEQYWIGYYTRCIRKGINTYMDVGYRDWKEIIKDTLMKEIEDGTASVYTIDSTVKYFKDQIDRKRITINDVPDILKSKVEELINE